MHPNDGRVVSNFIMQAIQEKPITIYGDGSQTRSFCYVSDLIEFFIRFMDSDKAGPGPINAGNPGEFSMLELARSIKLLTNSASEIVFCPLPSDDPRQRKPDISMANNLLNWEPSVELREGLENTIAYFKSQLG